MAEVPLVVGPDRLPASPTDDHDSAVHLLLPSSALGSMLGSVLRSVVGFALIASCAVGGQLLTVEASALAHGVRMIPGESSRVLPCSPAPRSALRH